MPKEENVDISSPVPACTSIGCAHDKPKKSPYPVNYPVPNFGMDEDIKTSQANEAAASAKLGHKWVPKTEEIELANDLKWGSLMQLNSDPICPSSGCKEKKYKGIPRNYFVPDFGVDSDIVST